MRILLDTNILLNDFFHRNPDFGFQRISDPAQKAEVEAYREKVHQCLERLSRDEHTEVLSSTAIFARFAALLGDLLAPADLVLEELSYWKSNLKLLEVNSVQLESCLQEMQEAEIKLDFDDYLLRHLCKENQVDLLLSSIPKSREFYWPVLFFKPENIGQLLDQKSVSDQKE
jgi:hypothetical protein